MMKSSCFLLACFISLVVVPCVGAEMGMVTLVDGKPRLLRGTAWFTLSEGVRIRDGDTIDLPEKGQLQIELTDGGAVSAIGPGALYAASLTPRDGKQPPLAEFFLPRGWLKLDAKASGTRLRIRSPNSTVMASEAVAVMHATGDNVDMFVETGSVKMTDPAGPETKGGGYVTRAAGKSAESAARAPSAFVGAMPRDFMDPLPQRAAKFASARPDPAPDREATFPEAQPWLTGPYRAAFMKRFEPKLGDPAFRTVAEANGKGLPESTATASPAAAKAKAEPTPPPVPEKPKEPERTWHWPWETPKK